MELWQATKLAFKNFATFTGTTSRADYWYFVLALFLGNAIANVIDDTFGTVFAIATLTPWLAASARRLRDSGRPMSLFWFLLIPFAGIIIFLIVLTQPSVSKSAESN